MRRKPKTRKLLRISLIISLNFITGCASLREDVKIYKGDSMGVIRCDSHNEQGCEKWDAISVGSPQFLEMFCLKPEDLETILLRCQ